MKKLLLIALLLFSINLYGQATLTGKLFDTETNLPLSGANIHLENTLIGTATDDSGEFIIKNLELKEYRLRVGYIGYSNYSKQITIDKEYVRLEIGMEPISIEFNSIVVTGTRTEKKRTEVPIIVNVLGERALESTNSKSLLDGLNFQSGVRMEIDCQTCNYSQVRLNGLGGSYTQILINSRPIFSALSGLYGLEQIPTNMLDRVEVIRGGGSALFGANAVGGTINIITREPQTNYYSVTVDNSIIDGTANDRSIDLNASVVDPDITSGITVFGNFRNRSGYDANSDGFTEIPQLSNNSFGLNSFYKLGRFSKITVDAHSLHEERRGGNKLNQPAHLADQAEDRIHNVLGGGITFTQDFPYLLSSFSTYVSGQHTDRKHYTGIDGVDAYGTTDNSTIVAGAQFSRSHKGFLGSIENTITVGVEGTYDDVKDEIPGYNHYLAQITRQLGGYLQLDWKVSDQFGFLLGVRGDSHSELNNFVLNPRMNLIYNVTPLLQARASFSTGFRAPQAFDADLHIAFSGGGISRIEIDPNLKKETSTSYSASLDFNKPSKHMIWGFTLEAFYTSLNNVFILEDLGADPVQPENTILLRKNGGKAFVAGGSVELRTNYDNKFEVQGGVTIQSSEFEDKVFWSDQVDGSKKFFKSPNVYGFYLLDIYLFDPVRVSMNGVITGPMYVPHVAGAPGVTKDELFESETFFEANLKLSYRFSSEIVPTGLEIFGGVQNILNQYQDDFDTGRYRDSNYVYGPAKPRTFFMGIKIGA